MASGIEYVIWASSWLLSITAVAGFLRASFLWARARNRMPRLAKRLGVNACAMLAEFARRDIEFHDRVLRLDELRGRWEAAHELGPVLAAAAGPCRDAIGFHIDRFVRRFDGGTTALCQFSMRSATLLGLAGTCVGMIQALSSQAAAGAPSPATAMPGISTSLWATVIGIAIATLSWLAVKLLLESSLGTVREAVEEAAWRVHEKAMRMAPAERQQVESHPSLRPDPRYGHPPKIAGTPSPAPARDVDVPATIVPQAAVPPSPAGLPRCAPEAT
jgi:biopolymer transport protein ExbB/TolQ